jgi:hypothetical protein
LVEQEISSGDAEAVANRQRALTDCAFLDITPEAVKLAERLIEQNVVPQQAAEDALHIAVATVSGIELQAYCQCRHARQRGIGL